MIPIVFDNPVEKCIDLVFDFENGLSLKVSMEDEQAQSMINIIQNKLDARF